MFFKFLKLLSYLVNLFYLYLGLNSSLQLTHELQILLINCIEGYSEILKIRVALHVDSGPVNYCFSHLLQLKALKLGLLVKYYIAKVCIYLKSLVKNVQLAHLSRQILQLSRLKALPDLVEL